jgi:hypothetical protein
VLFGGAAATGAGLGDTWEWDGLNWIQAIGGIAPSARSGHALVFDPSLGRVVLFGGLDAQTSTALGDTWTWDGTIWQQLAPITPPPARVGHALCYDVVRSRAVLFGGRDATGTALADTWEWDGAQWIPVLPVSSSWLSHTTSCAAAACCSEA